MVLFITCSPRLAVVVCFSLHGHAAEACCVGVVWISAVRLQDEAWPSSSCSRIDVRRPVWKGIRYVCMHVARDKPLLKTAYSFSTWRNSCTCYKLHG